MTQKAIVTCSITGTLTDPIQHNVPVTPEQLAAEAKIAYDAGAAIIHLHFRDQRPGKGHLPSWDPAVAKLCSDAIHAVCPDVIINQSTGVVGNDYEGALDCVRAIRPEFAACNAGSLNYLKVRADNTWAWPPMLFDNPVEKVQHFIDAMAAVGTLPEFECFDTGIVRCVAMYAQTGMYRGPLDYNFVMGVASGMPSDPDLLPLLLKHIVPGSTWQTTVIGRSEIWPVHRRTAELGGNLRTGLEDTFYLPDGSKVRSNGPLIEQIVRYAREAGREIANPDEAREIMHIGKAH